MFGRNKKDKENKIKEKDKQVKNLDSYFNDNTNKIDEVPSPPKQEMKEKVLEQPEVVREIKAKKDFNFLWKISTFLFGISTIGLLMAFFVVARSDMMWMIGTFVFLILFVFIFIFLIFLSKKTHAILEFKAMMTGKPISLFFTDHKSLEWKVLEPEGNILVDKKYGAFIINSNGNYVDSKTKNVFMAFNPAVGTSASIESFKISDTLQTVIKDERQLSRIREIMVRGEMEGDDIIFTVDGRKQKLSGFDKLRENVNFSHLKSLMNTLIPHAINSKIEMTIQQRMAGTSKINVAQIILLIVSIIGAAAFAIMLLNIYGK